MSRDPHSKRKPQRERKAKASNLSEFYYLPGGFASFVIRTWKMKHILYYSGERQFLLNYLQINVAGFEYLTLEDKHNIT